MLKLLVEILLVLNVWLELVKLIVFCWKDLWLLLEFCGLYLIWVLGLVFWNFVVYVWMVICCEEVLVLMSELFIVVVLEVGVFVELLLVLFVV